MRKVTDSVLFSKIEIVQCVLCLTPVFGHTRQNKAHFVVQIHFVLLKVFVSVLHTAEFKWFLCNR